MFWAVGFSLGVRHGNGFAGSGGWFMNVHNSATEFASLSYSLTPIQAQFFFQVVFCAVSLAIVFGAMLDRTKFVAYIIFGVVFTGLIYPTVAHWTWGGGWLAQDGFLDFAGSSIVHLQGALAALAGTLLLGPRIGKFRNRKAVPIPGHSIPLAMLGVLILWVGWMGFNPGSTLNAVANNFADIAVNTNLAAAAGVMGATIGAMIMFKTLDVSQMGNGAIAGARGDHRSVCVRGPVGCGRHRPRRRAYRTPAGRARRQASAWTTLSGVSRSHGIAGIWGTLSVGLFAATDRRRPSRPQQSGSVLGGGGHQLWVQFYGVAATIGFTVAGSFIVFAAIKYTVGLRVSEREELAGLDISEHGMFGYPERFIEVPGAEPEDADVSCVGVARQWGDATQPAPAS